MTIRDCVGLAPKARLVEILDVVDFAIPDVEHIQRDLTAPAKPFVCAPTQAPVRGYGWI